MTNKLVSIMEKIGHDVEVVWTDVQKYLPSVESLALLIFGTKAEPVINSISLIQSTVATVEQKFAASGNPTGTGAQKSAQVLAIVGPAVTSLLAQEKIVVNDDQIQKIINAVVAILNAQPPVEPGQPAPDPLAGSQSVAPADLPATS